MKNMNLSEQCSKSINALAQAIARLVATYPRQEQYLHGFFSRQAEKLKQRGFQASSIYDVSLVSRFGDHLEHCDFTVDSIAFQVDKSPQQTDSWVVSNIEDLLKNRSLSDYELVNQIRRFIAGKPDCPVAHIERTLGLCFEAIQQLQGNLNLLNDPLTENKNQIIAQYELHL